MKTFKKTPAPKEVLYRESIDGAEIVLTLGRANQHTLMALLPVDLEDSLRVFVRGSLGDCRAEYRAAKDWILSRIGR